MRARLAAMALAALSALYGRGAAAGCTRDIVIPVSASGSSVIVDNGEITGIFIDVLRTVSAKSGCKFVFNVVPRARQVAMYTVGQADMFLPASSTPERDKHGTFVPMIYNRPMLISVAGERAPITSARELLARRELRVAVVRGYDYGGQYGALLDALGKQGRLFSEVNATAVARLLHAGSVDLTIMGPTLMAGATRSDPRVRDIKDKLRVEAIPELPWSYTGAYISHTLGKEDQRTLREALDKVAKSPAVMDTYLRYFPADIMKDNVRPR